MPFLSRRRAGLAIALIFTGLAAFAPASLAAPRSPACGDTITTDTRLTADLVGCAGDGLVLGADGITLDLAGHRVVGDAIAGGRGIVADGRRDVTVEDGDVSGFDFGVLFTDTTASVLRRLAVADSASRGIQLQDASDGNVIEHDRVSGSARSGIALFDSARNVVRGNRTADNTLGGIRAFGSDDNLIQGNVASGSQEPFDLVEGSDGNRVVDNTASDGIFGVFVVADVSHNLVRGNRIMRTAVGVVVEGDANAILENRIEHLRGCGPDCEDCDDACAAGVSVEGGTGNLVAGNRIAHSTGTGIRVNDFGIFGGPHTIDTVIRGNLVRDAATDGIAVGTSQDPSFDGGPVEHTLVEDNTVIESGLDGIDIAKAPSIVIGNRTMRNARWGIEAVAGVTDGGGNHAANNGEPAQCLGVAC